jgi:hypothetical protein
MKVDISKLKPGVQSSDIQLTIGLREELMQPAQSTQTAQTASA